MLVFIYVFSQFSNVVLQKLQYKGKGFLKKNLKNWVNFSTNPIPWKHGHPGDCGIYDNTLLNKLILRLA